VGWGAGAVVVDALEGEVVVVAATHGRPEALNRGSLVAQSTGLAGGDLSAVELAFGRDVEDEEVGWFSRARERGVGPVAGEVLGSSDDAGPLDGGAMDGVRGQRVGVLEMLGHIPGIEPALGAGVGAHKAVLLGRVDGDHRAGHAVVHRPLAIGLVFVVVVFSVLGQGTLVPWVARRLGIPMHDHVLRPWELSVGLSEKPRGVHEFSVTLDAVADGQTVAELELQPGDWVSLVLRDGRPLSPEAAAHLAAGDHVFVLADPARREPLARLFTTAD
jgi:TrkA family protein